MEKTRAVNVIIYPESMPDWKERVADLKIPALAVVHDRDVDENGEIKKTHVHVQFMSEGPRTLSAWRNILEPLGNLYVEPTRDIRTMNRYLLHLDQPEKAPYNEEELIAFNGYIVDLSRPLSPEQRAALRAEVLGFIVERNIVEYAQLVEHCMFHEADWLDYVETHTIFLNGYIRSRRHAAEK